MKVDVNVDVHHLTRVEGHGNIRIRIRGGAVEQAAWDVVETPRYFEGILRGKHYTTAGILTARICGICSIGHTLASVRASEDAFGVTVPTLAARLRLLAKHAETLQSHALHVLFLAAPDFLGLPSAVPLATEKPGLFGLAARLKGVSNRLADAVAGRTTHPVSIQVGGMARRPAAKVLEPLASELEVLAPALGAVVDLVASFDIPQFERQTEFVSLKANGGYPWIGGNLVSSDGVEKPERAYREMTNEYVTRENTSKWCKLSRESFAVGALARFNNNHRKLAPPAQRAAEQLGLAPVCHNPYMNNAAQVVELVHVLHESREIIDDVLGTAATEPIMTDVVARAGEGVGAVEVPRGILYHHYRYDDAGRISKADCVIPTTQNNANIHHDIEALAREQAARGTSDADLERLASMLVRAYDPCISCSVH